MSWGARRREYKKRLERARAEGMADEQMSGLLDSINSSDEYYTTSSCAGRIVLLQTPEPGSKLESDFVRKWHAVPSFSEFSAALEEPLEGELWLIAQPPILHVVSRDEESERALLAMAISAGLKKSGIISLGKRVAELTTSDILSTPVAADGRPLASAEYLKVLHESAAGVLARSRNKFERFHKLFEESMVR